MSRTLLEQWKDIASVSYTHLDVYKRQLAKNVSLRGFYYLTF